MFLAVLLKVPYIPPDTNVGSERNIVYLLNPEFFEIGKKPFPVRYIGPYGGRGNEGYGNAAGEIFKKTGGIILEISCVMFASRNTAAAGDTFVLIDFDFYIPFFVLVGYIC